jgi:uncharacterized protein YecE (DUF72 family)
MDFGMVEQADLERVDFGLPADPVSNRLVLPGKKVKKPSVYLGCAKWGRKEWVGEGKLYPPKTKEKDFLRQYVLHYNSIELNATHYKIYGALAIAKWREQAAGRDFKFCPKMYQGITHRGSLKGKDFLTTEFLRGVLSFQEQLGPIFIQFSESFGPKRKEEMFSYLRSLPIDLSYFVEVRHPQWFADQHTRDLLFLELGALNMGAVITDTAGRRDCCHMHLTQPRAFIRYVGNSLHPTDYTRIDNWVSRIKYWLDKGLEELYFFMHMHNEALSPELTAYLVDKLNRVCKLKLEAPLLTAVGQSALFP